MTETRSNTLRIVLACLASGIIMGLITGTQCHRAESECHIAALQSVFSDPAPWTIWLYWINWLPGMIFGLLFAVSALQAGTPDRWRRTALYAIASGGAYLIAGLAFTLLVSPATGDEFGMIVWVWPAAIGAGLIGALALAVMCNVLIRPPDFNGGAFSRSWLPALVGAVVGVLFVWICIYGEQLIVIAWPIAFSIWQVSVGLTMALALLRKPRLRGTAP